MAQGYQMKTVPTTTPAKVTVVIVHVANLDFLRGCLNSLANSTFAPYTEIIIIDNMSGTEDIETKVAKLVSNCRVIQTTTRTGFATASNIGFRAAEGEYVLWINDDTLIHSHAVQNMVEFLEDNSDYAIVGAKTINPDGSYRNSFSFIDLSPWREWVEQTGIRYLWPNGNVSYWPWLRPDPNSGKDVRVVSAQCLIRREAIEAIDYLDERFFLYAEEFDLCRRFRQACWKIRYEPKALITHIGGASTVRHQTIKTTWPIHLAQIRSRLAYYDKHYNRLGESIGAQAVRFGALARIIYYSIGGTIKGNTDVSNIAEFYIMVFKMCGTEKRRQSDILIIDKSDL